MIQKFRKGPLRIFPLDGQIKGGVVMGTTSTERALVKADPMIPSNYSSMDSNKARWAEVKEEG